MYMYMHANMYMYYNICTLYTHVQLYIMLWLGCISMLVWYTHVIPCTCTCIYTCMYIAYKPRKNMYMYMKKCVLYIEPTQCMYVYTCIAIVQFYILHKQYIPGTCTCALYNIITVHCSYMLNVYSMVLYKLKLAWIWYTFPTRALKVLSQGPAPSVHTQSQTCTCIHCTCTHVRTGMTHTHRGWCLDMHQASCQWLITLSTERSKLPASVYNTQ